MDPGGALAGVLTTLWGRALRGPGVVAGGRVLSPYGRRPRAGGGTQFHLGVDLTAASGTFVRAVAAGVVVGTWRDGELAGYGNTVVVAHAPRPDGPPTAALYAHLSRVAPGISRGVPVAKGQILGGVGSSGFDEGSDTPPHLHLEVLVAPPGDRTGRAFTHFHGGANWYPPRVDPVAFAGAVGMDVV